MVQKSKGFVQKRGLCRDIKIYFFKLKSVLMKALTTQALMLGRMLQNYHVDFLYLFLISFLKYVIALF